MGTPLAKTEESQAVPPNGIRPVRGRLAPTPSGHLHVGNARSFLAAWLHARSAGGKIVLRIEDIDRERCRAELEREQLEDLRWLGLLWDEGSDVGGPSGPYRQSERLELYRHALAHLVNTGTAYPCVCTRKDILAQISLSASAPHDGEELPYPRTCRGRFASTDLARAASGREPAWRLLTSDTPVAFRDELLGPRSVDPHALSGDFPVMRRDGWPSYQLAVVVDDATQGITQVVRGMDLLPSTARQLLLYRQLGLAPPDEWLHLPLVTDPAGQRLAKRSGGLALGALRARGVPPERILGVLAHSLGLLPKPTPLTATEAITLWRVSAIPTAPVSLSEADFSA